MDNKRIYKDILRLLDRIDYIKPDSVPNIDIYMDQVTSFMDAKMKSVKRHKDNKVLTKTMINNYTKAHILPPPVRKKYTREHMFMLLFIYYYKGILSLEDLKTILDQLKESYFDNEGLNVEDIYYEVFSMEANQMRVLRDDIAQKYELAMNTFSAEKNNKMKNLSEEERENLRLFSFASELGFDIYLKQLMLQHICDRIRENKEKNA